MELVFKAYARLFARTFLYRANRFLFRLSARGIGILNCDGGRLSGEHAFVEWLCRRYGRRQITVLDVGANVGDYSLAFDAAFPGAAIYAFEPHPKTYARLQERTSGRGIRIWNLGLGDQPAQLKLYDYEGYTESGSEHASLFRGVIENVHQGSARAFDVEIVTLDAFVEQEGIGAIHLLKIDTEGNELNVLKGATRCLAQGMIECIHFEFNSMNVVSRIYMKDFFDLLPGFTFYRMLPDGLVPLKYDPLVCEIFCYQNIVAVRN